MKKLLLASAIAASFFASSAIAQVNNFTGFSAAANVSLSNASVELAAAGDSFKLGDNSENFGLQAAYGVALGTNFALSFGGTYSFGDLKAGTATVGAQTATVKGKDVYSLYVEPGYLMGNSTLAFAKVGYIGLKGEISASGQTENETFNGVGYGAGIRTMVSKNLFVQAEISRSDYSEKTINGATVKPTATSGIVGVGYKF